MRNEIFQNAMRSAIAAAKEYQGATHPNPPVGAVGLDQEGNILAIGAHKKAGSAHAEQDLLDNCLKKQCLHLLHTLVVTLEPCNHTGRTPACSSAILATKSIKRVVVGALDSNPKVNGGGCARLKAAGLEVRTGVLEAECLELIRCFQHWCKTGRPYVTVKRALNPQKSMLPPKGMKTFTSQESLRYAHILRKRANAILTGSGTVLADEPHFTVRHVNDHKNVNRYLVLLDRRKRISRDWMQTAEQRGFQIVYGMSVEESLDFLGKKGVLEVLVEAGPQLSDYILENKLWDEHIIIHQAAPDRIEFERREQ